MKRRCAIGKRRVMQMKKRLLCFTMLLTVTISAITFTNNVKAATKWNTNKSVTKEENGIKYSAYLTEDGKESWIYQIKLSKKITKLTLPKEINQAKLTRVGFGEELYGEGHDSYINILEIRSNHCIDATEHCHIITRIKERFKKLYFPIP